MMILNVPAITSAITLTTGPMILFRDGPPLNACVQAAFVYGSGGTTWDAWVQTSLDAGLTWEDVAQFHGTTAALRAFYNLSALTVVTTQQAATDGSLAANTAVSGVIGAHWRVKYQTAGVYAGGTALRIDIEGGGKSRPTMRSGLTT